MTLECFNQRPLNVLEACRNYMTRRNVLDRLREQRGMSEGRHQQEVSELNASLQAAMQALSRPSLADVVAGGEGGRQS